MGGKTKIVCAVVCLLFWLPLAAFIYAGGRGKMFWLLFALGLIPTLCGMHLADREQEEV